MEYCRTSCRTYWPKRDLSQVERARREEFAPWELSVVGTKTGRSVATKNGNTVHLCEASSSSVPGSAAQEFESVRLCVYELQPIDFGENVIQLTIVNACISRFSC